VKFLFPKASVTHAAMRSGYIPRLQIKRNLTKRTEDPRQADDFHGPGDNESGGKTALFVFANILAMSPPAEQCTRPGCPGKFVVARPREHHQFGVVLYSKVGQRHVRLRRMKTFRKTECPSLRLSETEGPERIYENPFRVSPFIQELRTCYLQR